MYISIYVDHFRKFRVSIDNWVFFGIKLLNICSSFSLLFFVLLTGCRQNIYCLYLMDLGGLYSSTCYQLSCKDFEQIGIYMHSIYIFLFVYLVI